MCQTTDGANCEDGVAPEGALQRSDGEDAGTLTLADVRRARAVLTGTEAPPAAESPSDATSTTKDT